MTASSIARETSKPESGAPDLTCMAVDRGGRRIGGYSVWHRSTPELSGERVGYIGNYHADRLDVGVELLHDATQKLVESGCNEIFGPIDGSTWASYRIPVGGSSPPFALEPTTPCHYAEHFTAAGFCEAASYSSSLVPIQPHFADAEMNKLSPCRLKRFLIREFDMQRATADLSSMYEISVESFKDNFLYTPISRRKFLDIYSPMLAIIDPELVLIAELEDRPVGFIFALPNKTVARGNDEAIVIKTLARLPGDKLKGCGLALVNECHRVAFRKGYSSMIHALYKDDNRSSTFSHSPDADVIRRYVLFGKTIDSSTRRPDND